MRQSEIALEYVRFQETRQSFPLLRWDSANHQVHPVEGAVVQQESLNCCVNGAENGTVTFLYVDEHFITNVDV